MRPIGTFTQLTPRVPHNSSFVVNSSAGSGVHIQESGDKIGAIPTPGDDSLTLCSSEITFFPSPFPFPSPSSSSPSLPWQVMPPFLHAIRSCSKDMREYMFKQLAQIVSIIKQHARDYMQDIFSVIRVRRRGRGTGPTFSLSVSQEFWTTEHQHLQNTIILLIEKIVAGMGDELKVYIPRMVEPVLKLFLHDQSKMKISTQKVSPLSLPLPLSSTLSLSLSLIRCWRLCSCVGPVSTTTSISWYLPSLRSLRLTQTLPTSGGSLLTSFS